MTQYNALKGKTGIQRLINASNYSWMGVKTAFKTEEAFRHIIFLNLCLFPLNLYLPLSKIEHLILILVGLFAIIVELINSAIEAAIDRISLEIHPLSKNAKDLGSAAQTFALVCIAVSWGIILWQ